MQTRNLVIVQSTVKDIILFSTSHFLVHGTLFILNGDVVLKVSTKNTTKLGILDYQHILVAFQIVARSD